MSQYLEDTEIYVAMKESDNSDENIKDYIYAGDTTLNTTYKSRLENVKNLLLSTSGGSISISDTNIDNITTISKESYRSRLAVEAGDLTWFADSESDKEVQWCLDVGLKVFVNGYGFITSSGEYQIYSEGEYTKASNSSVYCCSPDLTGFNTGSTYYIVYDSTLTKGSMSSPIYSQTPSGWYDYGSQKWANVVTVNNSSMAYFTWIPRYVYRIVGDDIEVRFVDTDNRYIAEDGSPMSYDALKLDGFSLPDAFSFGGEDLKGIWVSKYEISDPVEPTGFSVQSDEKSITVQSITWSGNSTTENANENLANSPVTIRISGGGKNNEEISNVTLPYKIENLNSGTTYTITVETPTYYEDDMILTKEVTTMEGTIKEITAPDLSGFNTANTYYVTFDSTNKSNPVIGEKIETKADTIYTGRKIASNAPDDWYDYSSGNWANIVTQNNKGEAAFWVWVPRYEYKVDSDQNICDIVFISANKEKADDGYEIPDAFKFNKVTLSGIWVSKYEIENVAIPTGFTTKVSSGQFTISNIIYDGGSTLSGGLMPNSGITVTITPTSGGSSGVYTNVTIDSSTGYTIKSLQPNGSTPLAAGTYTVSMKIPLAYEDSVKNGNVQYKTVTQTVTIPSVSGTAAAPDLSGFSSDTTYAYYCYGDSESLTVGARITFDKTTATANNIPTDWYDYANNKWANIVVSDEELQVGKTVKQQGDKTNITVWVWIPRYEYRIDETTNAISAIFIGVNETKDANYEIPDAFTFGTTPLTGFWCSKYEISNEITN
jgi:hypothetical protein